MIKPFTEFLADCLNESVKSANPAHGYSGELRGSQSEIRTQWNETFAKVKAATGEKDDTKVRDYLDSAHGRHLIKSEDDVAYIKKDFAKFSKTYNPKNFS